jgi:steroid 5-alpha reductase family enzyme
MAGERNWNHIVFAGAVVGGAALLATSGRPFLGGLAVAVISFTALWLISLAVRDAGIADIFWGPGCIVLGAWYLWSADEPAGPRAWIVTALAAVWAIRLAVHIGVRNRGAAEDFRYRQWREQSGGSFWWVSFFKVFLLQAVTLWLVSSPLLLAHGSADGPTLLDVAGIALFAVGFAIEVVADHQLARFKADPDNAGLILDRGLWGRSRHPNYFGEAVLWWGLGLLAVPTGGPLALLGPAVITFLLVRVSGVAMLDAALVERRPGYAEYIRTTPAFVPRLGSARRERSSDR